MTDPTTLREALDEDAREFCDEHGIPDGPINGERVTLARYITHLAPKLEAALTRASSEAFIIGQDQSKSWVAAIRDTVQPAFIAALRDGSEG